MNIEKDLFDMQDKKYQVFQFKLCPGVNNIIGVRIPELRKYAKKICNSVSVTDIGTDYQEEIMLKGMLIGLNKDLDYEQIENFIPLINNWVTCDTFCSGLKKTKNHLDEMWNFLQKYLKSSKEYEIRFAVVMVLQYYINESYVDSVLKMLSKIKNEGYYAQMAVAWAYSMCFIKFYDKTKEFFVKNLSVEFNKDKDNLIYTKIDNFIYNKSIQKALESYKLTKQQKEELKKLKIKFI